MVSISRYVCVGLTLAAMLMLHPQWGQAAGPTSLDAQQAALEALLTPAATGDALWNEYARLWCEASSFAWARQTLDDEEMAGMAGELPEAGLAYLSAKLENPPRIPDSLLAGQEPRFGDDPRYWQLRWFNAWLYNDKFEQGDADPTRFLRMAQQRGATDAATDWLLLQDGLEKVAGTYTAFSEASYQQQLKLLQAFVQHYPAESLGWYALALKQAEYGDLSEAAEALRSGNAAPSNSCLLPFPASLVQARLEVGEPAGSEVVAGAAFYNSMVLPEPLDHTQVWEFIKNCEVAAAIGDMPLSTDALARFGSRLALMEGAGRLQRSAGLGIMQRQANNILATPGSYSSSQLQDVLSFKDRLSYASRQWLPGHDYGTPGAQQFIADSIREQLAEQRIDLFGYALASVRQEKQPLHEQELEKSWHARDPRLSYGLFAPVYGADMIPLVIRLDAWRALYRWAVQQSGPPTAKARQEIERLTQFDMDSLAWPVDPGK
jgi:hypothetical protein